MYTYIYSILACNFTVNLFRTAKAAANGNLRLSLKSKPQVKCHRSLPAGQSLEDETCARQAPDFRDSPQAPTPPQHGKG